MKARKGRGVADLVVPYLSSHLKPAMMKARKNLVRKQIVATFDPNRSGTYGDGGDGAEAIGIESYVNAVVDDDSKLLVKQGKESGVIQLGPAYQEPLGSTYLSVVSLAYVAPLP
ncbi:hypothetical protein F2Q69_00025449 [Brassica cretica]|uniref:Uncharacterized protein n=1 Tax=Brassica cretica TaxID=69181 RepID=A0A8S9QP52_BRACR|nr:hypothetical protein F2Q69_00025449 [Brassica cretica]